VFDGASTSLQGRMAFPPALPIEPLNFGEPCVAWVHCVADCGFRPVRFHGDWWCRLGLFTWDFIGYLTQWAKAYLAGDKPWQMDSCGVTSRDGTITLFENGASVASEAISVQHAERNEFLYRGSGNDPQGTSSMSQHG